jgi:hypothetical protein
MDSEVVLVREFETGDLVRLSTTKSSSERTSLSPLVDPSRSSLSETPHTISSSSEKDDSSPNWGSGPGWTGVAAVLVPAFPESVDLGLTATKPKPEDESEEAEGVGEVIISESEGLEI